MHHGLMTSRSTGDASTDAESTRSVGELLVSFMAGSIFLPFFQGVVSKASEDIYVWLHSALPRKRAAAAEDELVSSGQITVVDPVRRLAFELPADIEGREASAILSLRIPTASDTWLLVRKDYSRRLWVIVPIDGPPAGSVEVGPTTPVREDPAE
ncbi:hypothetical protein [Streptomyces sp. NPDC048295]|uniref:hypothetical protein n=1 Tax=Streptomyces sp. NPDC048295 TaxID=3154617 RepID=UPI00343A8473